MLGNSSCQLIIPPRNLSEYEIKEYITGMLDGGEPTSVSRAISLIKFRNLLGWFVKKKHFFPGLILSSIVFGF